jgi:hypothetical protein
MTVSLSSAIYVLPSFGLRLYLGIYVGITPSSKEFLTHNFL